MDISSCLTTDLFAADLSTDTPTHDLHGKSVGEALIELDYVLTREANIGADAIRIIHGRGSGTLRQVIHAWLTAQRLRGRVRAFRDSEDMGRAGGVTIVLLPKKEVP